MSRKYIAHGPESITGPHMRRGLPQVELEIVRGRARNRIREITAPAYLIGAAADCDLVIGDQRFPEAHSYLLLSPESVAVRWLGVGPKISRNGLLLNRALLEDGDVLEMGPYQFRVSIQYREPVPQLSQLEFQDIDDDYGPEDFDAGVSEIRDLLRDIRQVLIPAPAVDRPGFRRLQRSA